MTEPITTSTGSTLAIEDDGHHKLGCGRRS